MNTDILVERHSMAERTSSTVFGLALTVVFVGLLVLNAISY